MDTAYLKREIGTALRMCLSEVAEKRPFDPIDFISQWLYKFKTNKLYKEQVTDDKLLSLPEQDVGVKLGECGVIVLKEIFTKLNGAVYKNYQAAEAEKLITEQREFKIEQERQEKMKEEALRLAEIETERIKAEEKQKMKEEASILKLTTVEEHDEATLDETSPYTEDIYLVEGSHGDIENLPTEEEPTPAANGVQLELPANETTIQ